MCAKRAAHKTTPKANSIHHHHRFQMISNVKQKYWKDKLCGFKPLRILYSRDVEERRERERETEWDGFSFWFAQRWSDQIHADRDTLGWNVTDNYWPNNRIVSAFILLSLSRSLSALLTVYHTQLTIGSLQNSSYTHSHAHKTYNLSVYTWQYEKVMKIWWQWQWLRYSGGDGNSVLSNCCWVLPEDSWPLWWK